MKANSLPVANRTLIYQQLGYVELMEQEGVQYLTSIVKQVVRRLHEMKCAVGFKYRSQLLMESENISASSSAVDDDEKYDVTSYILFSSTMECNYPFSNSAFRQICDMMHIFYIITKESRHKTGTVFHNIFKKARYDALRGQVMSEKREERLLLQMKGRWLIFQWGLVMEIQGCKMKMKRIVFTDMGMKRKTELKELTMVAIYVNRADGNEQSAACEARETEIGKYDDLPIYVKLSFPRWFPKKLAKPIVTDDPLPPWASVAQMPKEGEDPTPKGELIVMPMSVCRFQNLGQAEILASYRMFFNTIPKNAKKVFVNNESRKVGNVFEYNVFTSPWLRQTVK